LSVGKILVYEGSGSTSEITHPDLVILVTDVKAIFLIFYSHYNIWELYLLGLKSKVFCKKFNQIPTQHHEQGTHSAKIGTALME
jgi:hypothetical protein